MIFQVIWFILWGVLWTGYFVLDGFDLGAGMLLPFLARTEAEKSALRRSIGPVWDGNEVWLLTAGGATFAAFPAVYGSMFSFLYSALLLVLFGLIIRGVSLEFRSKSDGVRWAKAWDAGIYIGSLLPALLLGVAFGNLFAGLPFDASGYHGSLFSLLNPYGIVAGFLFLSLFTVHGALWLALKIEGEFGERALGMAKGLWPVLLTVAVIFLALTPFATELEASYLSRPYLLIVPLAAVLALFGVRAAIGRRQAGRAFALSGTLIGLVVATGLVGMFPNLLISKTDAASTLTIYNASSSPLTLKIMTVVAVLFVPVVIGYQVWVYRVFRRKIAPEDASSDAY